MPSVAAQGGQCTANRPSAAQHDLISRLFINRTLDVQWHIAELATMGQHLEIGSIDCDAVGGDQQLMRGTERTVVWMELQVGLNGPERRPEHVPTLGVIDETGGIARPVGGCTRHGAAKGEVKQQTHSSAFVVRRIPGLVNVLRQ
jgi:hypothetical protein